MRHTFCGARPTDLSLRGPNGAVAISCRQLQFRRWLSNDPTRYYEIPTSLRSTECQTLRSCAAGSPPQYLQLPQALTARKGHAASVRRQSRQRLRSERRYRRKRSVRFFGSRYGTAVPSRDCHVGLRPPRNDKPVSLALSAFHFQLSIFHSRLPLPCNFPHKGPQTVKKPVQPEISEGRKV